MICIGDLCYRYPNQLEQWTNRIYSVLKDKVVFILFLLSSLLLFVQMLYQYFLILFLMI